MNNGIMRIFMLTIATGCFSFLFSVAQPLVKTSVDKSEILIGDQFKLTIEAILTEEANKVIWPVIPDSLPHFEVISRSKMDSSYNNNNLSGIVQTLTLTSFDSGKWTLPSFLIQMTPVKNDTSYNFFTDSLPVTVSFSTADTTNQLRDIKPIMEVETINPIWYWIGAGVLVIALVIFLIWFFRYRKKNKASVSFQTRYSPYEEAMRELENLKSYDLAIPGDIKIVHTKLGEIVKLYLSRRYSNNYDNKTTGDILIVLNEQKPDKEMLTNAAASLRCTDAVKFAKYLPPFSESEECIQSIKAVIEEIEQTRNFNPQALNLTP